MEILSVQFFMALGSIIILDLVLAGDNAVVIALASRSLPNQLRNKAIYIGTVGAIGIRMLMTLVAVWILTIPFLQAVGGLVLIPIAIKLLKHEDTSANIESAHDFWGAIKTIIVADAAMGIDNVLAIAGASHGNFLLVFMGLLISVPIVVWGSQLIAALMQKHPALIYFGSGILGWTSGTMVIHDKIIGVCITAISPLFFYGLPAFITAVVLISGWMFAKKTA
jgi:YjbE family integral membrane protein